MESDKKETFLREVTYFLDENREAVKVVSYGISTIGLSIALFYIRPFAKFKKPSDLPSHFLKLRTPIEGTVKRIEPSHGTLLMVDHKPLIALPRLTKPQYLPVKMAGIDVTTNGISWLQTVVNDNRVILVPLIKREKYLECLVSMPQKTEDPLKIGEELVKLGFATVQDAELSSLTDKDLKVYRKSLMNAQKWAERKRNGYWHYTKQPTLLWKLQTALDENVKKILPVFITRRLNI